MWRGDAVELERVERGVASGCDNRGHGTCARDCRERYGGDARVRDVMRKTREFYAF